MRELNPAEIDAILPQTQCGLCGFGGCLPYATALAAGSAEINLCPPGGVSVLKKLGKLLLTDPAPYIPAMEKNSRPAVRAVIREEDCIGCVKCIQACPVDAILGSAKNMHTVIALECTGCELCVAPCPVDCIDLVEVPQRNPVAAKQSADLARVRYHSRNQRLAAEKSLASAPHKRRVATTPTLAEKKSFVQEAIARAQQKKAAQSTLK
jgi:electron transport complex protein RnfB